MVDGNEGNGRRSLDGSGGVALVSGCSSGFGLVAAIALARAGFRVAATMRNLDKRSALDEAAKAAKVEVATFRLDVCSQESIEACAAEVERELGPVEVLVNNAGYGIGGFLEDLAMAEIREQFETNFFGAVALTKAVVPGMRERRRGRIINVSSIGGRVALPGVSAYCATKFAMEGLSESLRYELSPLGIYVSLIEPGVYRTNIFESNLRLAARATGGASPHHARTQHILALTRKQVADSKADPEDVGRRIAAIATAKRPRLRYLIGGDARGQAFAKAFLPSGMFERVINRVTVPRKA